MASEGPSSSITWTKRINDEIAEFIEKQTHDKPFIGEKNLRQIWTNVLHHHGSTVHASIQRYRDKIREHDGFGLLVTLTVLVGLEWNQWDRLDGLLMDNEGNFRHTLPLTRDQAKAFHWKFYDSQFTYLPKLIVQDDNLEITADDVLPFTEPERYVKSGGSGEVTKVVIAPGFFKFLEGGTNPSPYPLARKKFRSTKLYKQELEMLKNMRDNLHSHTRILQHLCTIEIKESREFSILSKFADGGDLDTFLHAGRPDRAQHSSAILEQASYLADAIDFLHAHFKIKGTRQTCYHMDLKPGNILVFEDTGPVGVWKITDFGLSVLHDLFNKSSDESANSKTISRRPPGTFQAPEVQEGSSKPEVNAKGDIWSYGGILCMVLAFTVNGPAAVKYLEMIREISPTGDQEDDFFYTLEEQRSGSPRSATLKPQIAKWLESMEAAAERKADRRSSGVIGVIRKCLQIDADLRPSAKNVFEELNEILTGKSAQTTRSAISRVRTGFEPPAQATTLLPTLNIPPKRSKAWRPSTVTKHIRTASQPGPGIIRLSSPISTRPRNASDSPMMPTPPSSSSRGSLMFSGGQVHFIRDRHSTAARVISIDQNADHLLWAYPGQVMIHSAANDDGMVTYSTNVAIDATLEHAYLGGAYLVGYERNKREKKFVPHCLGLSAESHASFPGLVQATDHFQSAAMTAVSPQGEVVLMYGSSLRLFEASPNYPIEYKMPSSIGKGGKEIAGKDVFKTISFSKSGHWLWACGLRHWFRWSVERDVGKDHWFSRPQRGEIAREDWRDPELLLLSLQTRAAFLLYDTQTTRLQMYDTTRRQMSDRTQKIALLSKIYSWCLSPGDEYLFYIRAHALSKSRFKPARLVCGLFKRSIDASGVGNEELVQDIEGVDAKESVGMAFHEHKTSQELVIISSAGTYHVIPATYEGDEQLFPSPAG